jgi:hypothetical protein
MVKLSGNGQSLARSRNRATGLQDRSQHEATRRAKPQRRRGGPGSLVLIALGLLLSLATACSRHDKGPKLPAPDVSALSSDLMVYRADTLLRARDQAAFRANWERWYREHPAFAVYYRDWLLQIPPDTNAAQAIYGIFAEPPMMRELADTLSDRLEGPDKALDRALEQLDLAYRYHRYYFPDDTLPPLYLYSGVFGQPVDILPDFACAALTMFLGPDFSGYEGFPSENLPRFLFHRLSPEYLPVSLMGALARSRWEPDFPDNTVLQHMLYEGKLLAYLDRVLPHLPDSLKIGFTARQMDWVNQNQGEAWALLVGEELLFSTRSSDIARVVGEGPHTKGMSFESPARVGVWMGWQIVRAYLERYPDTSLESLFAQQDARALLEASRWKPRYRRPTGNLLSRFSLLSSE